MFISHVHKRESHLKLSALAANLHIACGEAVHFEGDLLTVAGGVAREEADRNVGALVRSQHHRSGPHLEEVGVFVQALQTARECTVVSTVVRGCNYVCSMKPDYQ